MSEIYKYRVYCTTDSKYVNGWYETEPDFCPENNTHTIDSSKTSILDSRKEEEVLIKEEITKTGGHYGARSVEVDTDSAGWTDVDVSFPYAIGLLSANFIVDLENHRDEIEFLVAPDATTGTITQDVAINDTIIDVSQTVIDNVAVGYCVKLDDGTTTNDLGRVLAVDKINLKITVETAATNVFANGTPTYVKQTVKMVENFKIGKTGRVVLGESKIGASHIPANTTIRCRYNNINGVSKKFSVAFEYLY